MRDAASVRNATGKPVTVFHNSGYAGHAQTFAAGVKGNLDSRLKNNNATIDWAGQYSSGPASPTSRPLRAAPGPTRRSEPATRVRNAGMINWIKAFVAE